MFNRFGGFSQCCHIFSCNVMRCLFLSLNVDGVFLHTTKKFLLVIVFLFCFLLFCSFASQFYFFVVFLVWFGFLQNKVQFGFTVAFF